MPTDVMTVLLAGFVALTVTTGIGALMWDQVRREHRRETAAAAVARSLEVHRARLGSYPAVFEAMAPLSTQNRTGLTPQAAGAVAQRLNAWLYSVGGMCADTATRGAVLGLRDSCARWAGTGQRPPQLYEFRNLAVAFLRRDLDLSELDASEVRRNVTLLGRLRDDLDALGNNRAGDAGARLDTGAAAGPGPAADGPSGTAWLPTPR